MLTEQETRLNEQITALIGQNNDVIGQVRGAIFFNKTINHYFVVVLWVQNKSLEHQLETYKSILEDEKRRASKHIDEVEGRMREMQVHSSSCDVIVR